MTEPPQSIPPLRRRGDPASAVMIAIGIVLLLPGICALVLVSDAEPTILRDPQGLFLVLVCFAISAAGLVMIWVGAAPAPDTLSGDVSNDRTTPAPPPPPPPD
jgi:hypothetical protein